jgi:acid phosphatase type 7
VLVGRGGGDILRGGAGNDKLIGGGGRDVVRAALGADLIDGGRGDDVIFGGPGNDRLLGRLGLDRLLGQQGDDRLWAHDGLRDRLVGGLGEDVAFGDRLDARSEVESFTIPTPAPPVIKKGPTPGGTTARRDPTFVFSSAQLVRFECRIDAGPWTPCAQGRKGRISYRDLPEGRRTFAVRAIDHAGSPSDATIVSWSIDLTAPVARLTSRPADGTSRSATFHFTSSESGIFQCKVDSARFRACGSGTAGRRDYSDLAVGEHTFSVRAKDSAGNVSVPVTHRWTILPPPSPSDPTIAAAGDIACDPAHPNFNGGSGTGDNCRQLRTSDLLVGKGYRAVLPLGDNQYYCGSYRSWLDSYDRSWGRVKGITRPAVGNHEYLTHPGSLPSTDCDSSNSGADGYFRYFGSAAGARDKGYYSYDIGAWHLIALNSNCGDAGGCHESSPQLRWLRSDLQAHANRCTLAYWHVPLFSSGGRDEAKTRTFWQALYNANADVVLTSHDHTYERFAPQNPNGGLDLARGIRQFVVGTGGSNHTSFVTVAPNSEVRNSTTYGVLRLTLRPGSYDWKFVPEQGKSFTDQGTNTCH